MERGARARREEIRVLCAWHFGWAGKRPGSRAAGGLGGTEWREKSMAMPTCKQRCGAVGCELPFHSASFARKACMLVCKGLGICCARLSRRVPAPPGRAGKSRRFTHTTNGRHAGMGAADCPKTARPAAPWRCGTMVRYTS